MEHAASGSDAPRISSVEPPPMSITSTGSDGVARRLRTAPSNDSAASTSPDTTSGSTPRRERTPATKSAAFDASREAEVATNRTRDGGTS